jgi:6-phosphogluconolactonase
MTERLPMIRNTLALLLASAVVFGCHHTETSHDASAPGGAAAPEFKMPAPSTYAREFLFALNPTTVSAFVIDSNSGALTLTTRTPLTLNEQQPTSIAINPSGKQLFVTSYGSSGASIFAFAIALSNGALTPVSGSPFQIAAHAIASVVAPSRKFLYFASEDEGAVTSSVSGFSIDPDSGALRPVAGSPFAAGTCARDITIDPSSRFLYMAGCAIVQDRGSISVLVGYTINSNGALSPIANSPFPVGTSGILAPTTSVAVHPSDRFVYAPDPFASSIWVFNLDPGSGALAPVAGSPFMVGFPNIPNQPGAVALDPSGQFAYVVTNRGAISGVDTAGGVWGFKVDSGIGSLRPIAATPTRTGDSPSNAIIDPSGKFVYVANRENGSVSAYKIAAGGMLTPLPGSPITVMPEPGGGRWAGGSFQLVDIVAVGVN